MFIWPDGDVTGAEHWDVLAALVSSKPGESGYYVAGAPSKEGWGHLEALLTEHLGRTQPADESAKESTDEAPAEVEPEPPKRGPGRPRKED